MRKSLTLAITVIGLAFFVSCDDGPEPVRVSSVSMVPTSITLTVGDKHTLAAVVLPEEAENKQVSWSVDNPDVATYDPLSEEVTGMGTGTTIITATAVDGGMQARCEVTVTPPVPTLIGEWRTTLQYFNLVLENPEWFPEELKNQREQQILTQTLEADSYRLMFAENGTGFGSGVVDPRTGTGRFNFKFTWQISDEAPRWWVGGHSPDAVWLSYDWVDPIDDQGWGFDGNRYYGGVFLADYIGTLFNASWLMEEFTVDKLVLSFTSKSFMYGRVDGVNVSWVEIFTYRYTFVKVQ